MQTGDLLKASEGSQSLQPAELEARLTPRTPTPVPRPKVVFRPGSPWAYVILGVADVIVARRCPHASQQLCLRSPNVTRPFRRAHPHPQPCKEVPVDSHATEW